MTKETQSVTDHDLSNRSAHKRSPRSKDISAAGTIVDEIDG